MSSVLAGESPRTSAALEAELRCAHDLPDWLAQPRAPTQPNARELSFGYQTPIEDLGLYRHNCNNQADWALRMANKIGAALDNAVCRWSLASTR